MNVLKKLLNFFFQGLLLIAPIAITIYIVYEIFEYVDGLIKFNIPGIGLAIVLVSITLIGYFTSTFIGNIIFSFAERMVDKVPLLKTIIHSIKDMMSAFVGKKKKFNEPVRVTIYKETGIERIGFLTRKDLGFLGIANTKVAVYFPDSFGFTGRVFIVDSKYVEPLPISPAEAMKFIISGGVIDTEN